MLPNYDRANYLYNVSIALLCNRYMSVVVQYATVCISHNFKASTARNGAEDAEISGLLTGLFDAVMTHFFIQLFNKFFSPYGSNL